MKVTYDPLADAVYIRLTSKSQDLTTHMFDDWVAVDIGENGAVVGFEILDASNSIDLDQLKELDFEECKYDDPALVKLVADAAARRGHKRTANRSSVRVRAKEGR